MAAMPRSNSGGHPAPSAAASPAPLRNPFQQASPSHAPAKVEGASVLRGISSILAEGLAWGVGSSIANRAVDAVMGPCTFHIDNIYVDIVHFDSAKVEIVAPSPAVAAAQVNGTVGPDACNTQSKAFQHCIDNYGSDISKCQFYIDMLNECRRGSATVARAE